LQWNSCFSTIVRQGVQSTLIVPVGIGLTALRNGKSAPQYREVNLDRRHFSLFNVGEFLLADEVVRAEIMRSARTDKSSAASPQPLFSAP
jgi:hypothetical protein